MRLVLASSSPRRRVLLSSVGLEFDVEPPLVDETRHPDELPAVYVERIAREKASAVAGSGKVVIAADTAVLHRGHLLGKPSHPAEAKTMLSRLAGDAHSVLTGVAVAAEDDDGPVVVSAVETTVVRMLALTDEEIDAYVDTGEPMDKAGGYGLQGIGAVLVEGVEGSPSNVVGLPLHVLARLLRTVGVDVLRGGPAQSPER